MEFYSRRHGTARIALVALLLPCGTIACESEHDDHEDPLAEACTHLRGGPALPLSLAATDSAATDLTVEHRRLDLTFASYSGGNGGVGKVAIDAAGDWLMLLSVDVPLEVVDPAGAVVAAEASVKVPLGCPGAAVAHTFELEAGAHLLRLGPTSTAAVQLVVEAAADHAH